MVAVLVVIGTLAALADDLLLAIILFIAAYQLSKY